MEIRGYQLPAEVNTELLVEALSRIESLDLQTRSLPPQVITALLTKVTEGCSLKELFLHNGYKETGKAQLAPRRSYLASKAPAALLASAFTRLTKVHLTHTLLTNS